MPPRYDTPRKVPPPAPPASDSELHTATRLRDDMEQARAEATMRARLDASPNLVVVHDGDLIVYANPQAAHRLGHADASDLHGRSILDLVHPDDRAVVAAQLDTPGAGPCPRTLRLLARDGRVCTVEETSIPVVFGGSPATAMVAADVTERNEERERLLVADRLAAIGTLAAGAAHEINNPLTYALINVEHAIRQLRALSVAKPPVALDAPDGPLARLIAGLGQAQEGMLRVRDISRNLLTFSHGALERRSLVDVRSVVESSIQMAMHEIVHRARLKRELSQAPPVDANAAALGQVFLNLLVNAAHAVPEGDPAQNEIRVATWTDSDGRAVVEVSDTGVGIPAHVLPRVFDPFFTSKTVGEGRGLGLSISHGTITSLGGTISVTSAVGAGTSFRVVLPAAERWSSSSTRPASLRVAQRPAKRRVLVVDDDALVGDAIARALAADCDVETLTQGREALRRLATGERWNLILCDVMMPDLSGATLYGESIKCAPDAAGRIVFMTAGAFTPRARAFLESVADRCLDKPIDPDRLRELVQRSTARF